jgi:hypothetical protein
VRRCYSLVRRSSNMVANENGRGPTSPSRVRRMTMRHWGSRQMQLSPMCPRHLGNVSLAHCLPAGSPFECFHFTLAIPNLQLVRPDTRKPYVLNLRLPRCFISPLSRFSVLETVVVSDPASKDSGRRFRQDTVVGKPDTPFQQPRRARS